MPSDPDPYPKKNQRPPRRDWQATNPFLIRFAPLVQVGLGLLTILILEVQVCIYLRQTTIMSTQAGIANDANNLTKSIQRAFVYATDVELTPFRDSNRKLQYWRVSLNLENTGATPTKEIRWVVNPLYGPSTNPEFEEIEIRRDAVNLALLGPHMKVPFWDGIINRAAEEKIIKGQEFYILGLVDYVDVFDETFWHVTKFCFHIYGAPWNDKLSATAMDLLIDSIDLRFNMCRRNNCADRACKAAK